MPRIIAEYVENMCRTCVGYVETELRICEGTCQVDTLFFGFPGVPLLVGKVVHLGYFSIFGHMCQFSEVQFLKFKCLKW